MKFIQQLFALAALLFFGPSLLAQTTFNYTGSVQTYTVPAGVTSILVEAYGAQGGGTFGGQGGESIAELTVTPGEILEVYVGEQPLVQLGAGGFNGGGAVLVLPCGGGDGWPGGGASDVRTSPYSLSDRMIVAGGGGGQGWSSGVGGAGGGTSGEDGEDSWISGTQGLGGTASAGGAGGVYSSGPDSPAPAGSFGVGGDNSPMSSYCSGGAGGGGWYGGGGGYVSAGGGGSSYVSYPGTTGESTAAGVNSGDGYIVITELCIGLTSTVSDDTICEGETVILHAGSPGGGTISWDGGVIDSVAFTPPLGTTTYNALSSVSGECGFSVEIVVEASPTVEAGADQDVCDGDEVTLSGTGTADSWDWSGGVTDGVEFTPPTGATVYYLSGTLASTGCTVVDSVTLTVTTIDPTLTVTGGEYQSNQDDASYQWIDCSSLTPIAGATNQLFTPTSNGDYAVVIDLNGCQDTSVCQSIFDVGTEELLEQSIKVYPNPVEDVLTIEAEGDFSFEVIDALGAIVLTGNGQSQKQVDLSSFESGTYLVKVQSAKIDETIRLTKL